MILRDKERLRGRSWLPPPAGIIFCFRVRREREKRCWRRRLSLFCRRLLWKKASRLPGFTVAPDLPQARRLLLIGRFGRRTTARLLFPLWAGGSIRGRAR